MFLHLGEDVLVMAKDIVGIMDFDKTTVSESTRTFLKTSEEEGFLVTIGEDMPKAFVVTQNVYHYTVYLSPISSMTLKKRYEAIFANRRTHIDV